MTEVFKTDIIIPVYRPGAEFFKTLSRLSLQTKKADHLIVINTEEAFWNPELEEAYPGMIVRHIRKKDFNHGGTRDLAAEMSDADILVFMTMDACPADRTTIEKLIAPVAGKKAAVSYARQIAAPDADTIETITREFNYPPKSALKTKADLPVLGIKTFFSSNVCAAYDRKVFDELGGFGSGLDFNEDTVFAARAIEAGYAVSYTAESKVIHSHNYSGREQYRRNFYIGKNQAEHPEVFDKYPSEGEGIRLVKKTASELVKQRKAYLIPKLVWISGCKYLGYRAGRRSVKQNV